MPFSDLKERLTDNINHSIRTAGGIALLSVQTFRDLFTRPFYFGLTAEQVTIMGLDSLLLVAITGLATGSVMALQFGYA